MASIASSKTAGSTHPPLTEPTTCPSSETAIEVPGPRGPERSTLTTVAIAAFLPSSRQLATLSTTGFIRVPPLVSISARPLRRLSARRRLRQATCQHFSLILSRPKHPSKIVAAAVHYTLHGRDERPG